MTVNGSGRVVGGVGLAEGVGVAGVGGATVPDAFGLLVVNASTHVTDSPHGDARHVAEVPEALASFASTPKEVINASMTPTPTSLDMSLLSL